MKTRELNRESTQRAPNKNSATSRAVRAAFATAIALAGIFVLTLVSHPAGMRLTEYWGKFS